MSEEQLLAAACLLHMDDFVIDFKGQMPGCDEDHIRAILQQVADGEATGTKAHRFIGWAQGVLCTEGYLTLDDARNMNRKVIKELYEQDNDNS